jgi:ribose-phosphate pyrophosphokinase
MKLFGLHQTRAFADRLAQHLRTNLAAHEERDFEDGEFKIRPLESVRGEHVIVCQSLAADDQASANDKLMRLLVFCGALKDASAERVTALIPYLAYWRKDRRTQPRDPITTSYVARLFEAVGVDAVATIDAHSIAALDNAFRCVKEHLEATAAFVEHFAPVVSSADRVVVVSPDVGGVNRARAFAARLATAVGRGVELAFMEKQRSGGRVTGELFAGDVQDAVVVIYDDLISTGGTIARAAAAAKARGAVGVHAAATHGVLSGDAKRVLGAAPLESLVVTDTVADVRERCSGLRCAVHVLDSAALFAPAVAHWSGER